MKETKKTPYAHVALHWEQDRMLDTIATFTNKTKMELIEMFVKSAHKALAYNFRFLGVQAIKMRYGIEVKVTIAPMPSIVGQISGVPMNISEKEHDKLVDKEIEKRLEE